MDTNNGGMAAVGAKQKCKKFPKLPLSYKPLNPAVQGGGL